MYQVTVIQSPELALRQLQADRNAFPYTSELPPVYQDAPPGELSKETLFQLEPVEVESLAYHHARDITPRTEKQRKMIQAIIDRGPTYMSCRFFQTKSLSVSL